MALGFSGLIICQRIPTFRGSRHFVGRYAETDDWRIGDDGPQIGGVDILVRSDYRLRGRQIFSCTRL
jgi:hypothetical protein